MLPYINITIKCQHGVLTFQIYPSFYTILEHRYSIIVTSERTLTLSKTTFIIETRQ